MKKYYLTICAIASLSWSYAQERQKENSKNQPSLQGQMEQLQRQMRQMFPQMMDSSMMSMPNRSIDSMMMPLSRSFSFFNDGSGWKQMLPDSSKTNELFQNMEGYMNFFKSDKNLPNLMEPFEGMFDGLMSPNQRSPSNKQRSQADPKDKKYKTDSI
jgi:hypothetical protein